MSRPPLTRRQIEILEFFRRYTHERGISPTLEEVARNFGVNKVTIFGHVSELERKGVLVRAAPKKSRARQIVAENAPPIPHGAFGHYGSEDTAPAAARPSSIRILGRIAAGSPIEALEDPEELELADLVPRDREVYALRVRGQSMIEDGIHDGDIVIVEARTTARDGEIVVAVLPDEEATLKRFYREAGGVRLEPANASMEPIRVPEVSIRGVVLGVVRRF